MHFSCLTSGTFLSRLGRPEVSNCIAGLKQYNYAYEEAGEEAVEMERVYSAVLNGDSDLTHMASIVLSQQGSGAVPTTHAHTHTRHDQPMAVDQPPPAYPQNGSNHHNPNAVNSYHFA